MMDDHNQSVGTIVIRNFLVIAGYVLLGNQPSTSAPPPPCPLDSAPATRLGLAGMERVITAPTRSGYRSRNIHGGQFCWI
jgi:hypothetical protein